MQAHKKELVALKHHRMVGKFASPTALLSQPALTAAMDAPLSHIALERIGAVDVMSSDEITGWAWDPDQPDETLVVEVHDGDRLIASMPANLPRPDLEIVGIGHGRYGFRFVRIGRLLPHACHRLRVCLARDGIELLGSPAWVTNIGGLFDEHAARMVEALATAAVETASDSGKVTAFLAVFVDAAMRIAERKSPLPLMHGDAAPGTMLHQLRQRYPALSLPATENPRVSVIIPAHDKFELTYACVKSIAENLPETAFEIILIDDCSADETALARLLLPPAMQVHRMTGNDGFIASCNRGAELARGEFLFFLNNDTIVRPGWLDALVQTLDRDARIGIAGARLLFPDGRVQDAGGIVWRLGDAWNYGRGSDATDPRFTFMRDADYVSGAALLIRRDLFRSLGGFDAHFSPAYYEDTDLAFRVRAKGFRVVVQPDSQIVHIEGASSGTDPNGPGVKRYQTTNHAKFYRRWQHVLAAHRPCGEDPELEAERAVCKRAYFIDDSVPTPDMDAGSNAALQHMLALVALGYKVTFIPADNMARIDPYTRTLESHGIECAYHPSRWSVEHVFRLAQAPPDLIYLHRFVNAFKYAGMARAYFPGCHLLYSVADLQFVRLRREAAIGDRPDLDAAVEEARMRDLAAMRLVDAVIVHSHYEADLLRSLVPDVPVRVLGWTISPRHLETPIERRDGIAFVGGYQHRPNVDAAVHLARDIMPLVRRRLPGITCHIAGSKMPPEVAALQAPGIETIGFVADLAMLFEKVRCTIAPLRFGAGVKGKVLDSFAHGLPCVMSDIAAEGLDLPEDLLWLVATSAKDFAQKIAVLHEDDALLLRLSRSARSFIERDFSFDTITSQLGAIAAEAAAKQMSAKRMGARASRL
jgi:GT2 family glycosyltransferase/glycosyltransferase involved in cell wall biosynthesis